MSRVQAKINHNSKKSSGKWQIIIPGSRNFNFLLILLITLLIIKVLKRILTLKNDNIRSHLN